MVLRLTVRCFTSPLRIWISFSRLETSLINGLTTLSYCFLTTSVALSNFYCSLILLVTSLSIRFSTFFTYSWWSCYNMPYSLTRFWVSTPFSMTSRYHLTIRNSLSSWFTFSLRVSLSFSMRGKFRFSSNMFYILTFCYVTRSAMENLASFRILKRRCSLSRGFRQS